MSTMYVVAAAAAVGAAAVVSAAVGELNPLPYMCQVSTMLLKYLPTTSIFVCLFI